jgi:5-(carboxyamino)imidazole ribonucleotide mutase
MSEHPVGQRGGNQSSDRRGRALAGVSEETPQVLPQAPPQALPDAPELLPDATAAGEQPQAVAAAAAAFEELEVDPPLVGIVMGSKSDLPVMETAEKELSDRGIRSEVRVMYAHREPDKVADYARNAKLRGLRVVIAGAGLSAALPGVVAAHCELPVIGVPLTSRTSVAGGLDALLSIAQMPPGVPVACVGVDNARNAAVLAARILSA